MISAGANIAQAQQLRNQSIHMAAQNQMMEQQLLMQQAEAMKRELMADMRRMLMKINMFLDKADRLFIQFPEYTMAQTKILYEGIAEIGGIDPTAFEDVGDMQLAQQVNLRISDFIQSKSTLMDSNQTSHSDRMKSIITTEEDELELVTNLLAAKENWNRAEPRFNTIDPIVRRNQFRAILIGSIFIGITILSSISMVAAQGECVEYASNASSAACVQYSGEDSLLYQISIAVGTIGCLGFLLALIPLLIIFYKDRSEWNKLKEQKMLVEIRETEASIISEKYSVSTSIDANNLRSSLVQWVSEMSPSDPMMKLEL